MKKCQFLHNNGKKCNKKSENNSCFCSGHNNEMKGGFAEVLFPLGKTVGYMTLALLNFNRAIQDKKSKKKVKK